MVNSYRYTISEDLILLFVIGSTSSGVEEIALPIELDGSSIVGFKMKRTLNETLFGVASRSVEIEFVIDRLPRELLENVLLPTKEKRLVTFVGGTTKVVLKGGLVVYLFYNGEVIFAGIHTDNYFDAEIDLKRSTIVVDFIELARYILESFDEDVARLIWNEPYYRMHFLTYGRQISQLVDLRLWIDAMPIIDIRRHNNSNLLALSLGSLAELLRTVFEDLARSLINRNVYFAVGIPTPELYERLTQNDGIERRGNRLTDNLYVVCTKNEKPLWLIDENNKTFWDAYFDWCVSTAKFVVFRYGFNSSGQLVLGTNIFDLEGMSTLEITRGDLKRITIRPLNSDWIKASLLEGYADGINTIEKRRFVSASGTAREVVCLFDTLPYPFYSWDWEKSVNLHYRYKFFYETTPNVFVRACDLSVPSYDWYSYIQQYGNEVGYVKAYRDYVTNYSYLSHLLNYYDVVIYGNRKSLKIEIVVPMDTIDVSNIDNCLFSIRFTSFFDGTLLGSFYSAGFVTNYTIDFVERTVNAEIITIVER